MASISPSLSPERRELLTAALAGRQRELRAEISSKLRNQDDPGLVGLRNRMEDTGDWAVADAMAAQDISLVSRDLAELARVEAALARMADGSYGECSDCGSEIPYPRLAAYPAARRCIGCQDVAESRERTRR